MSLLSSSSSVALTQYAITTTYVPPGSCTQSLFTQLPSPNYFLYLNYPDPVPSSTFTDCYPPVFMSSYLEQKSHLTPLPTIAPLICPKGYASVSVAKAPDGYLACCPDGMGLATSTQAPFDRPAFNGTCYTDISTILVTAYGPKSVTTTSTWTGPDGSQAYAIPIEGYAFVMDNNATTTSASPASSPTSTPAASLTSSGTISTGFSAATNTPASTSSSKHTGAIVGGTIGGVAGLALIFLAIFFLFIRPKRRNAPSKSSPELSADSPWQRVEMAEKDDRKSFDPHNPHADFRAELDGDNVPELEAQRNSMHKYDRSVL